jgi:hypothetical protein
MENLDAGSLLNWAHLALAVGAFIFAWMSHKLLQKIARRLGT